MHGDQADGVHFGATEDPRDQVVHGADGDHGYPAKCASVYVPNGPVGVVRQRVDGLDRHHRAFKGRHAVERQSYYQEAQRWVGAQLMPSA